jgi:hypothetical protein
MQSRPRVLMLAFQQTLGKVDSSGQWQESERFKMNLTANTAVKLGKAEPAADGSH